MRRPATKRHLAIAVAAALSLVALCGAAPSARAAPEADPADGQPGLLAEPPKLFTFKLDDPASPRLPLLRPFLNAEVERPGPLRRYLGGPWGRWGERPWWTLCWMSPSSSGGDDAGGAGGPRGYADGADAGGGLIGELRELAAGTARPTHAGRSLSIDAPEPPTWLARLHPDWTPPFLASTGPSFRSNGFDALWAPPPKPIPWWRCKRRPVTFVRHGGEHDRFALLHCDGSVAPEAMDRLSIIVRPVETPRPDGLLPDDPDPFAWEHGEWIRSVRLVNPRLLWLIQRIAEAFPGRTVYVYSGYRPRPASPPRGRGHHSLHGEARAMDISVMGVPNAALFAACRTLDDVGCGFYPNSKFVHVDVRRPGTGRAFWIDVSGPGEPSRYVDAWPGVVDSGGLAWAGGGKSN